jgi:hypothetical protein
MIEEQEGDGSARRQEQVDVSALNAQPVERARSQREFVSFSEQLKSIAYSIDDLKLTLRQDILKRYDEFAADLRDHRDRIRRLMPPRPSKIQYVLLGIELAALGAVAAFVGLFWINAVDPILDASIPALAQYLGTGLVLLTVIFAVQGGRKLTASRLTSAKRAEDDWQARSLQLEKEASEMTKSGFGVIDQGVKQIRDSIDTLSKRQLELLEQARLMRTTLIALGEGNLRDEPVYRRGLAGEAGKSIGRATFKEAKKELDESD